MTRILKGLKRFPLLRKNESVLRFRLFFMNNHNRLEDNGEFFCKYACVSAHSNCTCTSRREKVLVTKEFLLNLRFVIFTTQSGPEKEATQRSSNAKILLFPDCIHALELFLDTS